MGMLNLTVNVSRDGHTVRYRQTPQGKLNLTGDPALASELISALSAQTVDIAGAVGGPGPQLAVALDPEAPLFNLVAVAMAHGYRLEQPQTRPTGAEVDELFSAVKGALDFSLLTGQRQQAPRTAHGGGFPTWQPPAPQRQPFAQPYPAQPPAPRQYGAPTQQTASPAPDAHPMPDFSPAPPGQLPPTIGMMPPAGGGAPDAGLPSWMSDAPGFDDGRG